MDEEDIERAVRYRRYRQRVMGTPEDKQDRLERIRLVFGNVLR
jgi:hypothetical protein